MTTIGSQKHSSNRKYKSPIKTFLLKEDSTDLNSSSEDIETNHLLDNLDDSDEDIIIYERDPKTKNKVKSKKSYRMTKIDERVGFKIRLDDQFYSQAA